MDAKGVVLLVSFSVLLGLNQALVKLVNAGLAPLFQAGLRSVCAVVVVGAWMAWRGKAFEWRHGVAWFGCLNGVLFALEFAFLFLALDYSSVARVSVLFYTMPFFVAVGAHFLFPGEDLSPARVLGLLLAFAGVVAVIGFDAAPGTNNQDRLLGDALAIAAAVSWASLTLITRASRLAHISAEMNLLYCLLISGPLLVALAPMFGDSVREITPGIVGVFAFQVVFIVSLGFIVWLWVLSVYPVADMASFSLLTPLFGVFFGWLIFDDYLSPQFLTGLAMVCGGLVLINRRARAR